MKDGEEEKLFLCFVLNAGMRVLSMQKILSLKPNSQTQRRSADRKTIMRCVLF